DESWNVLQFRGQTGPYLEPGPGTASLNLLRMAREDLLPELRTLLERARDARAPARRDRVRLQIGGRIRAVDLEGGPLERAIGRCYLVRCQEEAAAPSIGATEAPCDAARLRQELDATREHLRTVLEEHEAANEELQSSHEEMQSANEELQSMNE